MTESENLDDMKAKIALGALFHRTRMLMVAKRTPPLWLIFLESVFILFACMVVPGVIKVMSGDEGHSVSITPFALGVPFLFLFALIQHHIVRLNRRIDAMVKLLEIDRPKGQ